jgi:ABC-type branched-subunit amino acid transport system substrate-binding protein
VLVVTLGQLPAAASSSPGVTATTIKVGIPYVDLAAVDKQFGLKINQGSFPDAYNALFAKINAQGGINGRKVVPVLAAVNPTGTAAAATACTQLTEDNPVFAVMSPLSPVCYLDHGVLNINSTVTQNVSAGAAQNFTLTPPSTSYDPIQLAILAKQGIFKNKKVGVFGGETTDQDEVNVVKSTLQKDGVKVVQVGVDSAPSTDQVAGAQQQQVIADHFKNAGVNEVVAVGTGSSAWPQFEEQNQSTYTPPYVATSEADLAGTLTGKSFDPQYVTNVIATVPYPSPTAQWNDPLIKQCVASIMKAYPSDVIQSPIGQKVGDSSTNTYVAPVSSCTNVALFAAIAKAAGKNLTTSSFTKAGFGLKNLAIPGAGGKVSFGPNQAYAHGPVFIAKYDPTTKLMTIASKPVSG